MKTKKLKPVETATGKISPDNPAADKPKPIEVTPEELTFDDGPGFRIMGYNRAQRWLMGQRTNGLVPVPAKVILLRCTFGVFGCFFGLALLAATANGIVISAGKKNLKDVAKNLVLFSTSISMLHKYFIFLWQERGITRITMWLKKVKTRNMREKFQPDKVERFLRRSTLFFYYSGNLAPFILAARPLLRNELSFKFPFIDDSQKLLIFPLVYISHMLLAMEVVYDSTCLINMLVTFRSEQQRLKKKWSNMRHSDIDGSSFGEQLKQNVESHVELLTVFKDLKKFKNAMFGYQVFATTLITCAMIYGCSKDTEFLREASTQMLPLFTPAFLLFSLQCWLGEEILFEFQEFHRAVHMTNWYEADMRCKRTLTIILEFTKKPQVLTGFTVIEATLNTFVETMRHSFSLYTILQAVG